MIGNREVLSGNYFVDWRDVALENLLESEAFKKGISVGIGIHQKEVVIAHERKIPLKVGEELYYLQNGRERLLETLEKMCK